MSRTAKSWHAHVNGDLCDGTPSDCPVTALRRAKATAACSSTREEALCAWSFLKNCDGTFHHADMASALLDGFSVEEVTAAEHTTDQPHE